ncbi:MAG: SpoVR family protein [Candidatus Nanoarchaeia archaeon]|nr:SpoVR family protein [Candidatus Nanoarchaeia archaeon]
MAKMKDEIEEAAKGCGLDFYPTGFYVVDLDTMNEVCANTGFPTRYSHWRFGMEYERTRKETGYGFSRLYELVINNDPAVAYLLHYNSITQQRMVMAHVFAHVDFFKNNACFRHTDRSMVYTMENHRRLIEKYIDEIGFEEVEQFIDNCLSIEYLIEDTPYIQKQKQEEKKKEKNCKCGSGCKGCKQEKGKSSSEKLPFGLPEYMRDFVDIEALVSGRRSEPEEEKAGLEDRFPKNPERDVLKFLIDNTDGMSQWKKDILSIIREESYYFLPQRQTKIMNEGWATFWHDYMMTEMGLAEPNGLIDYAKTMAGVIGGGGMNPYKLGFLLYHDIKERWDKGRYGKEYEEEKDALKKMDWDTKEGNGFKKMFAVREAYNDVQFIQDFMTDEFIQKMKFFTSKLDHDDSWYKISSRDPQEVRNWFIGQLINGGQPVIEVFDGNFENSKELLLRHVYYGQELDNAYRNRTLARIYSVWGRPVHIATIADGQPIIASYDQGQVQITKW